MLPIITLLATAGAVAPLVSASASSKTRSHNPHNPHRKLLKREITDDASTVDGQTYDFIIAGGGLAGLAMAARLSEWSNQTVLVVEAGGDGSGTLADGRIVQDMIDIPGNSYLHGLTNTAWDWAYDTIPQASANNLVKDWPRGKGLGGSGAVNGMYWNRGNRENYEAWKTLNPDADEDWGWDEVNRCIMKAENWTAARDDQVTQHGMNLDPSAHGTSGAIQAGFAQYMFDIVSAWIPSMEAVGVPAIDGGSGTTRGAYFCPLTLNPSNMTRSDSKAGYIDGLPPRDNLVILTGQQVTQITFNGTNDADGNILASGISFQATAGGTAYTANARKEVILSGGTVGTPQILQLSGIGPAAQLASAGVDSRLDLPVGYNLQDHITATMYFSTPAGTLTWNNLSNDAALQASEMAKYEADQTGMWTFVNEAVAFPNMADLLGGSSANYASLVLEQLPDTLAEVVANKDLPDNVAKGLSAQYTIQQAHIDSDVGQVEMLLHLLGPNNNIGIQAALQHPWSRGTVFITSNNAFTAPAINPDYFSVGYDIDIMDHGMQFARRLAQVSPMSELAIAETTPGANVNGDDMYDFIRRTSGTTYHPIGTCSMLPRDQGGVVDTRLIVYGTGNIRVVDSSIIPLHMSAHTMGTTYGVAEKAAEIIKRKYYAVQETASTSEGSSSTAGGSGSSARVSGTGAAAGGGSTDANAGLSNAAKIGVGVGVGAGAFALLAALIAFCCIRRKKRQAPKEAAWYTGGQEYDQVPKEGQTGEYPMANFTPPHAAYAQHGRTPSVSTMATADLASRDPMMANKRASSGFGFDGFNYDSGRNSGVATPNERFDEGGYPSQPPSGAWSPAHQKYTQVNI